jgi:hypothetical protein
MIRKAAALLLVGYVALACSGCIAATGVVSLTQPMYVGGIPVLVLTTFDDGGEPHDRVLARIETEGHLFVSATHWIRPWYHRALANPKVQVTIDGKKADYLAVPVADEERERLLSVSKLPLGFSIIFGFAPRQFLRLDPV